MTQNNITPGASASPPTLTITLEIPTHLHARIGMRAHELLRAPECYIKSLIENDLRPRSASDVNAFVDACRPFSPTGAQWLAGNFAASYGDKEGFLRQAIDALALYHSDLEEEKVGQTPYILANDAIIAYTEELERLRLLVAALEKDGRLRGFVKVERADAKPGKPAFTPVTDWSFIPHSAPASEKTALA